MHPDAKTMVAIINTVSMYFFNLNTLIMCIIIMDKVNIFFLQNQKKVTKNIQ